MNSDTVSLYQTGASEKSQNRKVGDALRPGDVISTHNRFVGVFIPHAVLRDRNLSDGAKLLYGRLCLYSGPDGRCNPKNETLAAEFGSNVATIKRQKAELVKRGWAFFGQGGGRGNSANCYFLWHESLGTCIKDPQTGSKVSQKDIDIEARKCAGKRAVEPKTSAKTRPETGAEVRHAYKEAEKIQLEKTSACSLDPVACDGWTADERTVQTALAGKSNASREPDQRLCRDILECACGRVDIAEDFIARKWSGLKKEQIPDGWGFWLTVFREDLQSARSSTPSAVPVVPSAPAAGTQQQQADAEPGAADSDEVIRRIHAVPDAERRQMWKRAQAEVEKAHAGKSPAEQKDLTKRLLAVTLLREIGHTDPFCGRISLTSLDIDDWIRPDSRKPPLLAGVLPNLQRSVRVEVCA